VIDYCIKNGSKRFVEECRDAVDRIESLKRWTSLDPENLNQNLFLQDFCWESWVILAKR